MNYLKYAKRLEVTMLSIRIVKVSGNGWIKKD